MASPKRLLVIGATGGTGRLIVAQALAQGHFVTAASRHADQLGIQHPALRTVNADVSGNAQEVAQLAAGHDAVISCLGRGLKLRADDLMLRTTPAILSGMRGSGVRRLLYMSAYGVGGLPSSAPLVPRIIFRTLLRSIYADKARGERFVTESDRDWTIIAPVQLTDGPQTNHYVATETPNMRGVAKISRADTAAAALACLADDTSIRRRLVVMAAEA